MFYPLNLALLTNNIVCACIVDSPTIAILCGFAAVVCVAGMLCKLLLK